MRRSARSGQGPGKRIRDRDVPTGASEGTGPLEAGGRSCAQNHYLLQKIRRGSALCENGAMG